MFSGNHEPTKAQPTTIVILVLRAEPEHGSHLHPVGHPRGRDAPAAHPRRQGHPVRQRRQVGVSLYHA